MLAIGEGHTNIVQQLLEHGADVSLQDKVSSSANIACVCVSVCPAAVHLAYSGSKARDVSCLSEYECLALSKPAPRPRYVWLSRRQLPGRCISPC